MNTSRLLLGIVVAFLGIDVSAQFVKGNEAVSASNAGQAELPPPRKNPQKPCAPDKACHAGAWYMVETNDGLQECTEPFARPDSCRPSSYGSTKRYRLWVVKSKGIWLLCEYPRLNSRCVDMSARPPENLAFPALQ
ncbi:hypothetical protein [Piscinibacter sp. HJYY11]|uniref:hypothetical protein n=1 Tax=Piscinibacter sp. HJYY11 TaxID=2801333 RepID=UPI00191EF56B|nr:hypothetical protein [Piscinibacter sp. HJYY11]MBL0726124.1 hypothetical protein [Piscinibacter sp. HJYY11]